LAEESNDVAVRLTAALFSWSCLSPQLRIPGFDRPRQSAHPHSILARCQDSMPTSVPETPLLLLLTVLPAICLETVRLLDAYPMYRQRSAKVTVELRASRSLQVSSHRLLLVTSTDFYSPRARVIFPVPPFFSTGDMVMTHPSRLLRRDTKASFSVLRRRGSRSR
jgi:hypothetical protein